MNPTVPYFSDALGRIRLVVVARAAAHGRLALRLLGMPPRPVTRAPADGRFTWPDWLFGYPPPYLVVDPHLQPEDVTGADLAVLVEPRAPGGQLWVRAVGLEHVSRNGLLRRLRDGAEAAIWQCPSRWAPARRKQARATSDCASASTGAQSAHTDAEVRYDECSDQG